MTDDAEGIVIAHVGRAPLRHAGAVFDLIHAHERATSRHIDPRLVERHRDELVADVVGMAADLMAATPPFPQLMRRDPLATTRARLATAIAQILHYTHEAMIEQGLSTAAARTPLAPMRSLMAKTIESDALTAALERHPELADESSRAAA